MPVLVAHLFLPLLVFCYDQYHGGLVLPYLPGVSSGRSLLHSVHCSAIVELGGPAASSRPLTYLCMPKLFADLFHPLQVSLRSDCLD